MKLNGVGASQSVIRQLDSASSQISKNYERLSSGLRINRASDDAAGLAISSSLTVESRILNKALKNINDGVSALNIASSALESQKEITQRLMELAEQSANGTYSNSQRKNINTEYQALLREFGRIGDSAQFNNLDLLLAGRGANSDYLNLQIGVDGSSLSSSNVELTDSGSLSGELRRSAGMIVGFPSFTLTSEEIYEHRSALRHNLVNSNGENIDLMLLFAADETNLHLTIYINGAQSDGSFTSSPEEWAWAGSQTFAHAAGKVTAPTLSTNLTDLANGATALLELDLSGFTIQDGATHGNINFIELTGVETEAAAMNSMSILSQRHADIAEQVGKIGAAQSRLQVTSSMLTAQNENVQAARSRINDADIAEESAKLIASQIRQTAAAQVLSLSVGQQEMILSLL